MSRIDWRLIVLLSLSGALYAGLVLLALSMGGLGGRTPFIYFQF